MDYYKAFSPELRQKHFLGVLAVFFSGDPQDLTKYCDESDPSLILTHLGFLFTYDDGKLQCIIFQLQFYFAEVKLPSGSLVKLKREMANMCAAMILTKQRSGDWWESLVTLVILFRCVLKMPCGELLPARLFHPDFRPEQILFNPYSIIAHDNELLEKTLEECTNLHDIELGTRAEDDKQIIIFDFRCSQFRSIDGSVTSKDPSTGQWTSIGYQMKTSRKDGVAAPDQEDQQRLRSMFLLYGELGTTPSGTASCWNDVDSDTLLNFLGVSGAPLFPANLKLA